MLLFYNLYVNIVSDVKVNENNSMFKLKKLKLIHKYIFVIMVFFLLLGFIFINLGSAVMAEDPTPQQTVNLDMPAPVNDVVKTDLANNPIMLWIQFFVNLLSVVIVVGSAVMIAFAGVQYTSSRDNAQGVQDAKKKIFNVVLGLLAYAFLYAFVQWLIPGGGGVFDAPATTP